GVPELLFCENETNTARLWGGGVLGFFKDGLNDYVVDAKQDAVNPTATGTKAAAHYRLAIGGGASARVRLRLRPDAANGGLDDFDEVMAQRRVEADQFYAALQTDVSDPDARHVQRQALAGMLWSKQFYCFDVSDWLRG